MGHGRNPLDARHDAGYQLDKVQRGQAPDDFKPIASIGKGVMRFVGGQISHTQGMQVKTPVATLGVRGGVVTVVYPLPASVAALDANIAGCRGQLVIGHVGAITLRNSVSSVLVRPGFAACVNSANQPIGEPFRSPDVVLQRVMALLTSSPGQTGA